MKVLWFPGNGALYVNANKYNGGGWTGALARELCKKQDVELGLAIPYETYFEDVRDGIKYYGIPNIKHGSILYEKKLKEQLRYMKRIVDSYEPDMIHVFGSEHTGGLVSTITDVPVVLHLQGIMNFLMGAWLPQNLSWGKYVCWNPLSFFEKKAIRRQCANERKIFASCRHYMGRTEMDHRVIDMLSPNSKYYYCSEMLRPRIYEARGAWTVHDRKHFKIMSVISAAIYKGGDVVLRSSRILKECGFDFEWNVYGVDDMSIWERLVGIKASEVNVKVKGVINEEKLVERVLDSDVFVHPSYIENSPNTVCEAQVLGIPVIATHVGGTSSLIHHGVDGLLVPSNDAYMVASYIMEVCGDKELSQRIGREGGKVAAERHDPSTIVCDVVNTYRKVLKK